MGWFDSAPPAPLNEGLPNATPPQTATPSAGFGGNMLLPFLLLSLGSLGQRRGQPAHQRDPLSTLLGLMQMQHLQQQGAAAQVTAANEQQRQAAADQLRSMLMSREGAPNGQGAGSPLDYSTMLATALGHSPELAREALSPQAIEAYRIAGRMPTAGGLQARTIQDQMAGAQNFPPVPPGMRQDITYAPTGPTVKREVPTSTEQLNVLAAQEGGGSAADQAKRMSDQQAQTAQGVMEKVKELMQGTPATGAVPGQPSSGAQYTPHPTVTITPEGKVGASVSMNPVTDPEELRKVGSIIQSRYKIAPTDPRYPEAVGSWMAALQMDPAQRATMIAQLDKNYGVGEGVAVPRPPEGTLGKMQEQELMDYAQNHPDPAVRAKAQKELNAIQQQKIQVAKESAQVRGEAFGAGRYGTFLDSADNNRIVQMPYGDYKIAEQREPGRFTPATYGVPAIKNLATFEEIRGAVGDLNAAISAMPDKWTPQQATKIAMALRSADPRSAWSELMAGGFKASLTPAQADYVTAIISMKESAYMLRQAGSGAASDMLREAIAQLVPSASTPSKDYARRQLNVLTTQIDRMERGLPFAKIGPEATPPASVSQKVQPSTPAAPSSTPSSGFSDAQRQAAAAVKGAFESGQITSQKAAKRLRDAGFSEAEAMGLVQRFQGPAR